MFLRAGFLALLRCMFKKVLHCIALYFIVFYCIVVFWDGKGRDGMGWDGMGLDYCIMIALLL